MRLQVTEEASLQSVILASIHCRDRVGGEERGLMLCKCMHACMQKKKKKVRHFHRINIHYKRQHSTCILNRSLPNATVHPGCNRGSTFYKLLNSWELVYYYCLSQNILHYHDFNSLYWWILFSRVDQVRGTFFDWGELGWKPVICRFGHAPAALWMNIVSFRDL